MRKHDQGSAAAAGARRATGATAERDRKGRFSARRKRVTVLRLLRGSKEDLINSLADEPATRRRALSLSAHVDDERSRQADDTERECEPFVAHHGHHEPGTGNAGCNQRNRKNAAARRQASGEHARHGRKSMVEHLF